MKTTGGLSAEIQESLNNFKVIIAFNRRDYFRKRFEEVNQKNYVAAKAAGIVKQCIYTGIWFFCQHGTVDRTDSWHLPDFYRSFFHWITG